jgi:hypothetical protein
LCAPEKFGLHCSFRFTPRTRAKGSNEIVLMRPATDQAAAELVRVAGTAAQTRAALTEAKRLSFFMIVS